MNRRKLYHIVRCTILSFLLIACQNDAITDIVSGNLRISLSNISVDVTESRTIPALLSKPAPEQFNLKVVRNSNGATIYNGKFTDKPIKAAPDNYDIMVEAGENPVIAFDAPFYKGHTVAEVTEGSTETTEVAVPCKIGNSLISVRFGENEEQHERFNKYYSNYEVAVKVANYSLSLNENNEAKSVYLRAESAYSLTFNATLKANQENPFSLPIQTDAMPTSLSESQHLIVTLKVEDVEGGVVLNVSKVDVIEESIEQTLPFEWLPAPTVSATHQFNEEGYLVGTKLSTSSSYPGCTWTTTIKNSNNEVVRTFTGSDALFSEYTDTEWPYLPAGEYQATFSYNYQNQEIAVNKMRNFTITSPENMQVSTSYYTSYTKYLNNSIAEANTCLGNTIYDIHATLKLAESIKNNSKYSQLISNATISGWADNHTDAKHTDTASSFKVDSIEGFAASKHTYYLQTTFDGGTSTSAFDFDITGIPDSISFRTYCTNEDVTAQGWTCNGNTGKAPTTNEFYTCSGGNKGFVVSPKYHVPDNIKVVTSLLQKFYKAGLGTTTMTVYVDAVPTTTTETTNNGVGCDSSNNTSANNGRRTTTANFSLTPENPYVCLANNGVNSGITSLYYIHEFTLKYR